jgi:anaerobic selenocysteine-containing dehydrogenase
MGLPRCATATVDAPPAPGRLRLLSPAGKWLLNSSYANDGRIAQLMGEDCVMLNAAEAQRHQLRDGQRVRLHNAGASLDMVLKVAEIVPDGTALTYKTRWPKLSPQGINVNALNPGLRADMNNSTALHGVEVEIAAA